MRGHSFAAAIAILMLGACSGGSSSLPGAGDATNATFAGTNAMQFVGFWESWSDTNRNGAFWRLNSVPASVTTVDVAFSIADSNQISNPQNTYPLGPGAKHIHAHGGKLLLSFGGATSSFDITDAGTFAKNLQAYTTKHPKLYDGFDFDDEVIPTNGQQQLIDVLEAVREAFPTAIVSFDAFIDGADPAAGSGHQGEDIGIIEQVGSLIDYVNVMAYDQYGWKPSNHPNCSYTQGSSDDCRLDVLAQFAQIKVGSETFPTDKILLGLMIGKADDGVVVTPKAASGYGRDMTRLRYGGVMIWDLDRDNPQAPPNGTGHPKGTYVRDISRALGT
jgi:chitinase